MFNNKFIAFQIKFQSQKSNSKKKLKFLIVLRASDEYLIIKYNSNYAVTNVKSFLKLSFRLIFEVNVLFLNRKNSLRYLVHEEHLLLGKKCLKIKFQIRINVTF